MGEQYWRWPVRLVKKKSFHTFLPSAAFSWTVFVSLTGCGRAYHIKEENV